LAVALLAPAPAAAPSPAACKPNLATQLASTRHASQLVTVVAPGAAATHAAVRLWQRVDGCWRQADGPWTGRLGRNGISGRHREGDGTTPSGAYAIGPVMYGTAADPGVRYRYHLLVCGDWWDEDPASSAYNTFRHLPCGVQPSFRAGSEGLWGFRRAYGHFAVLDYNAHPVVPGRGSAIFIHEEVGKATAGCVSLPAAELVRLLRWLRPEDAPLVVIGTRAEIRRL